MILAAIATGAAVAAADAAVREDPTDDASEVVTAAVLPVAIGGAPIHGIGSDQPLPVTAAVGPGAAAVGTGVELELTELIKAVQVGEELAQQDALRSDALAAGAPNAVVLGDRVFVQPVVGRVTSAAGPRWGTEHKGLDIANRIGTPIYAVTDGVVERSGPASGFGLWVVLRHSDGTRSVYGHINRTFVDVGQRVTAGTQIAEVGNRGYSTGPHLHLEIRDADGQPLDPAAWLDERGVPV